MAKSEQTLLELYQQQSTQHATGDPYATESFRALIAQKEAELRVETERLTRFESNVAGRRSIVLNLTAQRIALFSMIAAIAAAIAGIIQLFRH